MIKNRDTEFKTYYKERFAWIFKYTSKNFFYCVAKTLCVIIGLPIYLVSVAICMILTGVYMLFSWIPILSVIVLVICKSIIFVFDSTFYICILPDINKYKKAMRQEPEYTVVDVQADADETSVGSDDIE